VVSVEVSRGAGPLVGHSGRAHVDRSGARPVALMVELGEVDASSRSFDVF
jgi:hypothetical protein